MGSEAMRRTEDKTWMEVAKVIATRSKCDIQVGAVIIGADGRIQATGYNGPPAGYSCRGDDEQSCAMFCDRRLKLPMAKDPGYTDCPSNHAEMNALLYSDQARRKGGTMYITKLPCMACAKAIANSGIMRVIVPTGTEEGRKLVGAEFLLQCGVRVEEMWA